VGLPLVRGGSDRLVQGFQALIEEHGGQLHCNAQVDHIAMTDGRARGVHLADGRFIRARNIICSVTPQQLYRQLLPPEAVPEQLLRQAANYRFGRADMQIHIALSAPAQWQQPALNQVAMIHLCDGIEALSQAVGEADNGLLPARPTVVVGQPCAVDPSRAPEGQWILWIQLQELPARVRGDAAGEIAVPGDGQWTEELKEAYAQRILTRLRQHIGNLDQAMLAYTVLSPADLERRNCNLVGGDPYCGDCALDQNLLFRPLGATRNHDTCVGNVYHIGAATHPGPGLAGGSGYLLAQQLL
jgi:phytoene dehydrogenase-like protein